MSSDLWNRSHQIQRRPESGRVPQPGGLPVVLPAALPVRPRPSLHRAAGRHPVSGRRREGATLCVDIYMCQELWKDWFMIASNMIYMHLVWGIEQWKIDILSLVVWSVQETQRPNLGRLRRMYKAWELYGRRKLWFVYFSIAVQTWINSRLFIWLN